MIQYQLLFLREERSKYVPSPLFLLDFSVLNSPSKSVPELKVALQLCQTLATKFVFKVKHFEGKNAQMADAAPRARKAMTQAISVLFELLKNVSLLFKILAFLKYLPNIYSIL